ncbi:MAG TPA: TIGR01244 family phosphatase, partial [Alcanivorax sp.]|nr:TIGR01244 family phosphatase [Alcanivorax sp.]
LAVAGQIQPGQLEDIARQGFYTVINNRPDGEGDDQPTSDALKQAARAAGLAYYHLPVTPGEISDTDILGFAGLMQQSRGPVLAFCRTGNRSSSLWA